MIMVRKGILVWLLATTPALCAEPADLKELLDGVREIAAPGCPGSVSVFGDEAFAVVAGASGNTRAPVVAAARLERGRIVAFAHNGYFAEEALQTGDTRQLLVNAVKWAAGTDTPLVAVQGCRDVLAVLLREHFVACELPHTGWEAYLDRFDVLISASAGGYAPAQSKAVERTIRRGAAFLTADCPWGWQQLNPSRSLATDHGGNSILAQAGLIWTGGILQPTSDLGYRADGRLPPLLHAKRALSLLQDQAEGKAHPGHEELLQSSDTLIRTVTALPPDDEVLLPAVGKIRAAYKDKPLIRPDEPLGENRALERLVLAMDVRSAQQLPAERLTAHPSAFVFPGAVPTNAPRVTRQLTVPAEALNWHSTGLYAAPGECIEVSLPQTAAGKDLRVRIGCHTDATWHHDKWMRAPEISRSFLLQGAVTKAANAFGGLIYLEIPEGCLQGDVPIEIKGAVEAPRFVLGTTTAEEWRDTIRCRPAPWAEIETDSVILSVPSSAILALDDPTGAAEFWQKVPYACDELLSRPAERRYPERYVADIQISNGYMHSGYPIMTHLDVASLVVDADKLKAGGSWGHFHEMGHNHQSPHWTFDGTGEVTCNLFTMYVYDTLCGGKGMLFTPAVAREKIAAYFEPGVPFDLWKADPFLALVMYNQLRHGFGWQAYKQTFAAYDRMAPEKYPKTDDEKRDLWMVTFSRVVGRDLGPFFTAWRVPTSETARASVQDLPAWMPPDFPPEQM